eukprot:762094-Hanusia_phi.AAC.1
MASVAQGVVDPLVDQIDEHFLKQDGKIRADKLIMNNRSFADSPEKVKDEVKNINRKIFEGRWGRTRDLLLLSQTDMEQFTILLNLTAANLSDALTLFQSIGGSKKGILDKSDIAKILNLDIEDRKVALEMCFITNSCVLLQNRCITFIMLSTRLVMDRSASKSFSLFQPTSTATSALMRGRVSASKCSTQTTVSLDSCDMLVNAVCGTDGYVSFDELRDYILDFRYSNKFARARGRLKIETMMNRQLDMESFDNLTEEEFSLIFQKNPQVFDILLDIHQRLEALFQESFRKSQTEIPLNIISKFFNQDFDSHSTSRTSTARSMVGEVTKAAGRPTYNTYRPVKSFKAIRRISRDDDLIFLEMRRVKVSHKGSARKFSKNFLSNEAPLRAFMGTSIQEGVMIVKRGSRGQVRYIAMASTLTLA